ncbi:MAG: glutathione S-transferase family protein, partial [Gammaproteobacteria bacterium]|nr:glutathione S-transferase family protein [Gammaproteobacteria bacterium]
MLKLWGRKNSINVMKVLWCLDEIGLDYERVDAGMQFGVVNEDHYAALNPNRKVPALEDGELVLWESNVIVRYLSAKYATGNLCPADPGARALTEQWMDWQQTSIHPDVTYIFWGAVRNSPDHKDPKRISAAIENLNTMWGMLDAHLADRQFVLGDRLTMGDIPIGCAVWRWTNMDIPRPELPNLAAWHERLKQRPAFKTHIMQP